LKRNLCTLLGLRYKSSLETLVLHNKAVNRMIYRTVRGSSVYRQRRLSITSSRKRDTK
jgi:hypothetical protein